MPASLRSASPRKRVPSPATYDLPKMQAFTPLGQAADITKGVTDDLFLLGSCALRELKLWMMNRKKSSQKNLEKY